MIYFGEKLRTLRLKNSLTQQQLADKVELVKGSISAYEQSTKYPSLEVLIKLCNLFHVSADYLLGLSDNMEFNKENLTDEQTELVLRIILEFEQANK
jgi:transcriptional regulator with XRE-family HTH domain